MSASASDQTHPTLSPSSDCPSQHSFDASLFEVPKEVQSKAGENVGPEVQFRSRARTSSELMSNIFGSLHPVENNSSPVLARHLDSGSSNSSMFTPWPSAHVFDHIMPSASNSTTSLDMLTTSMGGLKLSAPTPQSTQSLDNGLALMGASSGFPFLANSSFDMGTPRDRARRRQKAFLPLRELTVTRSGAVQITESLEENDVSDDDIVDNAPNENDTSAIANLSAAFSSVEDDDQMSMSHLSTSLSYTPGETSFRTADSNDKRANNTAYKSASSQRSLPPLEIAPYNINDGEIEMENDEQTRASLFISGVGLTPHIVRAFDSIHTQFTPGDNMGVFSRSGDEILPPSTSPLASLSSFNAGTSPISLTARAFSDIDAIHAEMGADATLQMRSHGTLLSDVMMASSTKANGNGTGVASSGVASSGSGSPVDGLMNGMGLTSVRDGPLAWLNNSSLASLAVQLSSSHADNTDESIVTPVTNRSVSLTASSFGNGRPSASTPTHNAAADAVSIPNTPRVLNAAINERYGDQSLLDGYDDEYEEDEDEDDQDQGDEEEMEMGIEEYGDDVANDGYGYYDDIASFPLLLATAEGDVATVVQLLYTTAKAAETDGVDTASTAGTGTAGAHDSEGEGEGERKSDSSPSTDDMLAYLSSVTPAQRTAVTALVNTCNSQHVTATALACRFGRVRIFELLLQFGADVDKEDINNVTPLALAAGQGVAVIVERLLQAKANVHTQDIDGLAPLCYAVRQSREQAADLLLEAKASVSRVDDNMYSYLHIACGMGAAEMADLLIRHGAVVDAVDERMRTPLYLACEYGHDRAAMVCLEHKAEVRVVDEEGVSVLHWAVAGCGEGVVRKVLAMKADINATTEEGDAPLHWAVEGNRVDVITHMLKVRADPNAVDSEGNSVLDLAISRCGRQVVDVVKSYGGHRVIKY